MYPVGILRLYSKSYCRTGLILPWSTVDQYLDQNIPIAPGLSRTLLCMCYLATISMIHAQVSHISTLYVVESRKHKPNMLQR
jgi:hypothetical protein